MNAGIVAFSRKLSRDLLSEAGERRWRHVQGVSRRAELLAGLLGGEDFDILVSAAILHDIGYAPEVVDTGFHALDGARYLESLRVPDRVCALVAHHSCAYREAGLRGLEADLAQWRDESSSVRDALWWADMTTNPDGEKTNVHNRIEEIQKRYGPEHLVTFFIRQAAPELIAAVKRTEEWLKAANVDHGVK